MLLTRFQVGDKFEKSRFPKGFSGDRYQYKSEPWNELSTLSNVNMIFIEEKTYLEGLSHC